MYFPEVSEMIKESWILLGITPILYIFFENGKTSLFILIIPVFKINLSSLEKIH